MATIFRQLIQRARALVRTITMLEEEEEDSLL
jgi:hypothetical protein